MDCVVVFDSGVVIEFCVHWDEERMDIVNIYLIICFYVCCVCGALFVFCEIKSMLFFLSVGDISM